MVFAFITTAALAYDKLDGVINNRSGDNIILQTQSEADVPSLCIFSFSRNLSESSRRALELRDPFKLQDGVVIKPSIVSATISPAEIERLSQPYRHYAKPTQPVNDCMIFESK